MSTPGASTPPRKPLKNGTDLRMMASPASGQRRPSHLRGFMFLSSRRRCTDSLLTDPSVSRLRSHFRTPSTTTVNSIQNSAVISPALNSTTGPEGWGSPSHLSALSRTSSSVGQPYDRHDIAVRRSESVDNGRLEDRRGYPESQTSGEVTGFVFHTMKDCTRLLFQDSDEFADADTASPTARSGFLRRLSVATETEDTDQSIPRHWGLPTVVAVNGVIAVGTESGWVAVIDFKQELKRICGTESAGARNVHLTRRSRHLICFSISQILGHSDSDRYKSRRDIRRSRTPIGQRVPLRACFEELETD